MNPLPLSHFVLAGISALCLVVAPVESAGLARIAPLADVSMLHASGTPARHPSPPPSNARDWIAIGADVDEHGPVLWQLDSHSWQSNATGGDALVLTTYAYAQTIGDNFTFASVLSHHRFDCLDAQVSLSERIFYSGSYGTGDVVGSDSPGKDAADQSLSHSTFSAREDAMLAALCRERPAARVLA